MVVVLQQIFLTSNTVARIQVNPDSQSSFAPDGQDSPTLYAPLQHSWLVLHRPVVEQQLKLGSDLDVIAHCKPSAHTSSRDGSEHDSNAFSLRQLSAGGFPPGKSAEHVQVIPPIVLVQILGEGKLIKGQKNKHFKNI